MGRLEKLRAGGLERNAGLAAVVVLSALLVPQIITRALPTGTSMTRMYAASAIGLCALIATYVAYMFIAREVPRRTSNQLTSAYLGEGAGVLVVSARFVAYALLTVLGAGLVVNVIDTIHPLGDIRGYVLVGTILILALPVLIGRDVPWRIILACAILGALALGAVLCWALVLEALGGIDAAASHEARWDAFASTSIEGEHPRPFLEAVLGALFPAAVLALMSERVLTAPELRRVSPSLLWKVFASLLIAIVVTLYFVAVLRMPGHRLSVVTLSMALAFWGEAGQIVIGVCYVLAGIAAILTAYSRLPRLLRELALDRFLPDRLADAEASGPRVAIVALVALLASVLASVLTTSQAGAMVFIFIAFTIAAMTFLAMAFRGSSILRESVDKEERAHARIHKWGYRVAFIATLGVLVAVGFGNVRWALAAVLALAVPAGLLLFFRRGRVRVSEALSVDDLSAGRTLATRAHGVVIVQGGLDASVLRAVTYARSVRLSSLTALTVDYDPKATRRLRQDWKAASLPVSLTVLGTPRGASGSQIVTYVRDVRALHPSDIVVVFIPRVISTSFSQRFFISHSSPQIVQELRTEPGVVLAEVPYLLADEDSHE